MRLYAIKNEKSGFPLNVIGATETSDGPEPEVSTSNRTFSVSPVLMVGEFLNPCIFVTIDLHLAISLVKYSRGNSHNTAVVLYLPFQADRKDLTIVDVTTMKPLDIDYGSDDIKELLAELELRFGSQTDGPEADGSASTTASCPE